MRCPKDVRRADFEHMLSLAPKGAVLKSSKSDLWWREFRFKITGEPSRESGLRRGDEFLMCVTKKFALKALH